MASSSTWKTASVRIPTGSYGLMQMRQVRTKDGEFQVQREVSLPLPCSDGFEGWVEEMRSCITGLEDVLVDYENANEEYGTEINAKGWVKATPEQEAILSQHNFR